MTVDLDGVHELTMREELVWDLRVAQSHLREKDTPAHRAAVAAAFAAFDDLHDVGGLRDCE